MTDNKRVLILSVSVGTGHTRAAEAIKMIMQENYPGSEVLIIDTFNSTSPWLGKLIFGSYLLMVKRFPFLYRQIYNGADEGSKYSNLSKGNLYRIFSGLINDKLMNIINGFNPDVIVCTHAFTTGIMSGLKDKGLIKQPLMEVLTDFVLHPYLIYKNIDHYLVSVSEQKTGLIARGIPENKITVTGIPIHPLFNQKSKPESIKKSLGLKNSLPTILLMGGGLGIGPVGKIVKNLQNSQINAQLIVVVGKNEKLLRRLELIAQKSSFPMKMLGFVENVHELMDIADLIITKPGGLTIAEALAKGLPMILTKPIPGHEEKNAEFLIIAGAAMAAKNANELPNILNYCLHNPGIVAEMGKHSASIGRSDSAWAVAAVIQGKD